MKNWQHYWKGILAFIAPGAVVIGAAVADGSGVSQSEGITALVAAIVTAAAVTAKGNAE